MLQVVIKTVYFSLYKYILSFPKISLLMLLGLIIGSDAKLTLAQENSDIIIDKNNVARMITVSGTSGGTVKAIEITKTENTPTGYCHGFVDYQANHVLKIDTFFDNLKLEIESPADTTVLVKGDRGIWCNDDTAGANPMIEGQWQPGTYQVWVGSYQPDSKHNYQIKITD